MSLEGEKRPGSGGTKTGPLLQEPDGRLRHRAQFCAPEANTPGSTRARQINDLLLFRFGRLPLAVRASGEISALNGHVSSSRSGAGAR
jgi:hypothetical protein